MDPLSISASIIALLSAANATVRGLEKLRALRHASQELLSLFNEVSDLQAVLTLVRDTFQSLQVCGSQLGLEALHELPRLINRASDAVNDLNSFIEDDLMKISANGNTRIARRAWLGKDKKLEAFRKSVKEARENLHIVITTTNLRILPRVLLNIQEVAIVGKDNLVRSTATLEQIIDRFAADPSNSIDSGTSIKSNETSRNTSTSNVVSTLGIPQIPLNGASHQLRITTSLNSNKCDRFCYCQCHVNIHGGTPRWLQNVVGTLFYSYSGIPALNTRPCSSRRCRRSASSATSFCYYFPTWSIQRAFLFTSTWKEITGPGASWSIRVPRIIPDKHKIWKLIKLGNLQTIQEALTTRTVSPFDVDESGSSLLQFAELFGRFEICSYLLENGADWHLKNQRGHSAADLAWIRIFRDGEDCYPTGLRKLLGDDDDYNLQFSPLHRIVTGLSQAPLGQQLELDSSNLDSLDWLGRTSLIWASIRGNVEEVQALINNGSNLEISDYHGYSALSSAAREGSYECVLALLQAGAKVNVFDIVKSTPLHRAMYAKMPEVSSTIQILCQYGAEIEARDINGWTPLYRAAVENNSDAISALIQCGADLNTISFQGFSPLAHAIQLNCSEAIIALCKHGARFTWKSLESGDDNVLLKAALFGSVEVMEILAETPTEPISYDPDILYYLFYNYRAKYYVGPEEDPNELLAAFENLLRKIGRPVTAEDQVLVSDETHASSRDDKESVTDEYMDGDEDQNDEDEDSVDESDEDASDEETFEDAVEIQSITDSMTQHNISEP